MSPAIGWPSVSVTCSVASVAPALFVALNAGAWKDYFGSETRSDLQRAEWILFRFCGRFGTRRFSSVHVVFFLRAVCVCVSIPVPKENDHNVLLVNSSFDSLCTASRGQRDLRL